MKRKITKIWGIGLTLVLLVSLGLVAAPVSAGTMAWSPVGTPSPVVEQLQDDTDVNLLAVAPDGTTMFAYNNAGVAGDGARYLYKSTNAGATWTTTNIGTGLEAAGADVVALAVSPDYATDATVVAATATTVYRSINGGKSFGEVGTTALAFSKDDPVAPAKIIKAFRAKHRSFGVKAGILDKKLIASDDVIALADIPPREVLLAMIVGRMQSPISGLLNVLQGPIRDLACVLKNLAEQKEKEA